MLYSVVDPGIQFEGHMSSAEREPITGVPGRGVRGRSPPEAESFLVV